MNAPALHFAPTLEKSLVADRAHVTVPKEIAIWHCDCAQGKQATCTGFLPADLPLEAKPLERMLLNIGQQWIKAMALRDRDLRGDLRVHGPWVSHEFNRTVSDITDKMWDLAKAQRREDGRVYEDPSVILSAVYSRNPDSPYADYLITGDFVVRNFMQERVSKDGPDDE